MENERRNRTVWIVLGIVFGLLCLCAVSAIVGGAAGYVAGKGAARSCAPRGHLWIEPDMDHDWDFRGPRLPDLDAPESPYEFGPAMPSGKFGGVFVVEVVEGSPADDAGLCPGDVIVEIEGIPLDDEDLGSLISEFEPGDGIDLLISRGGDEREITVQLGRHPNKGGETPWLGITYREMPHLEFRKGDRQDRNWSPRR